jgi:hypothetical protein
MKLYRYFSPSRDIFAGVSDLDFTRFPDSAPYKGLLPRNYNQEYISRRLKTERELYNQFRAKGGKPQRLHPYYLTLGACDEWFFGKKHCFGSLAFELSEFDENTISFTYGDSIPTFMEEYDDGKEYRKKVYTFREIKELIRRYGLPQEWNPMEEYGPENYIEAQIWSDTPIVLYRPCGYPNDMGLSAFVPKIAKKMLVAKQFTENEQLEFNKSVSFAKSHPWWRWFSSYIRLADPKIFQPNVIHGILHGYKCAFFALMFALNRKLSENEAKTLVLGGLYHDIGRVYYARGRSHGRIGADIVVKYIPNDSDVLLEELKNCIRFHDLKEAPSDSFLLQALRDMDTLDYLRLGWGDFNPNYLQNKESKKLVQFAIELNIYCYFDSYFILKLLSEE